MKPSQNSPPNLIPWKSKLPIVALVILGIEMVLLSWGKWADPQVDFGRELYIPWQITQGQVLYRDIAFFYGPLSPYLNALLFKVFGTSLLTLAIFNIAITAGLACLIYHFFKSLADPPTAFYTTFVFITMFAFYQSGKQANFNFICPYTYGMTHGFILSFVALETFRRLINYPRSLILISALGFLLGCIFLTKSEIFVAAVIALSTGVLGLARHKEFSNREVGMGLAIVGFFFLIPPSLFALYFLTQMPAGEVLQAMTLPYRVLLLPDLLSNPFYRNISGSGAFLWNLQKMISAFSVYLLAVMGMISWSWHESHKNPPLLKKRLWIVTGIAGRTIFIGCGLILAHNFSDLARGLPLVLLGLACYQWAHPTIHGVDTEHSQRRIMFWILITFSLALLIKIFFLVRISYYGFVLALPGTLMIVMILIHSLPKWLAPFHIREDISRNFFGVLIIFISSIFLITSTVTYLSKQTPVGSGKDLLLDYGRGEISKTRPNRSQCFVSALEEIKKRIPENSGFVVFPEGVGLNYLSHRRNPTPHINFVPPEIIVFGEQNILKSFEDAQPEYFILVDRKLTEYGIRKITHGPLAGIYRWIMGNYSPVWHVGKQPFTRGKNFGITILKKNSALKGA